MSVFSFAVLLYQFLGNRHRKDTNPSLFLQGVKVHKMNEKGSPSI